MGGGLMQLVAYGAQDVYLTGNPQITFFKVVYRRHTNFSMESIEQTFNGTADFGKRVTCTVSRNGDLIHRVYLQVTLPSVESTTSSAFFRWVNYIGHVLIKQVDVEIGGQRIDRHYGDWLTIWNELTIAPGLKSGYDNMVGNTVHLTGTGHQGTDATTLYVPLQFWFCRNPGLALPLIALQYHEVKINLEFRRKNECYVSNSAQGTCSSGNVGGLESFCVPSLEYAALFIDYIYLDTDERRQMAQSSHEYLIDQLQFTGDESTVNTNVKVKLNFNHPVKELIWVVQRDDVVKLGYNQWNNYTDNFDMDSGAGTSTNGLPDADQLVWTNVEGGTEPFPFTGVGGVSEDYSSYLSELGSEIETGSGIDGIGGTGAPGLLTTNSQVRPLGSGMSLPGANMSNLSPTDFSSLTTAANYADHAGLGPINAGRNPVVRAKLQLNGHDRFTERLGSYFNLVQPYQHHTNIPPTGINVYSFALKPEEHQPSGTCNMSRIDNATLQLQLTPLAGLGSKIRVYSTNYNVLRIRSGMGGLFQDLCVLTLIEQVQKAVCHSETTSNCGKTFVPLYFLYPGQLLVILF
jgi:hypothetical protein